MQVPSIVRPMTYTEQEQDTIRRGFLSAVALVSKADPGFFATFKESMAASKAMAAAPEQIRGLLQGGLIAPPRADNPAGQEQVMLDELATAMTILNREPADRDAYRAVVLEACRQVAEASKGIAPAEQQMIDRIRATVDGGAAAAT